MQPADAAILVDLRLLASLLSLVLIPALLDLCWWLRYLSGDTMKQACGQNLTLRWRWTALSRSIYAKQSLQLESRWKEQWQFDPVAVGLSSTSIPMVINRCLFLYNCYWNSLACCWKTFSEQTILYLLDFRDTDQNPPHLRKITQFFVMVGDSDLSAKTRKLFMHWRS